MSSIVGVFATSHAPGITGFPHRADEAQSAAIHTAFQQLQKRLAELTPDAIVAVSVEHFTNFFLDNLPTFAVGTAKSFRAPATPEMAGFLRVEQHVHPGHPTLGEAIYRHALASEFDPSLVGGDFAWDENFCVPLSLLDPEGGIPVVPIIVNAVRPPMPTLQRCHAFGRMLRGAVEANPGAERIIVLGTGGLSHWVGLPESGTINTDFDDHFLARLSEGDIAAILRLSDDDIDAAGNGAHEIRTWVVAAGAAEDAPFEVLAYEPVPGWLSGTAVASAQL